MIDPAFLAVVRAVCYLAMIFLIVFDLPAVGRGHRLLLLSFIVCFAVLFAATVTLAVGDGSGYLWLRDYAVTGVLLLVVVTHLFWLNRRKKE